MLPGEYSPLTIPEFTALSGEGTLDIQLIADVFLFNATTCLQEEYFAK